ncbi:MAG: tetratricopeptide repeat protein [Gemmatimonadota bacterium]
MPSPSLLQRLKERKLVQWGLAYLAGAWVLFEVSDAVGGRLGWPDPLYHGLLLVLAVGFFVALILAWYHGEKGRQRVSGPELLMVAALMVIAGGVLSVLPGGEPATGPEHVTSPPPVDDSRPSIAVLPLDNISPNPEDAYFAAGMHEELTTRISQISALFVISRSSVERYSDRATRPSVPEIAVALGDVDYVLEGSARIAGTQVRITVQLIDGKTDGHLWSDTFDGPYSVEESIEVQSRIAREIASAIRVEISPDEDRRISILPTENLEAYTFFLRGRNQFSNRSAENIREAIRYYEAAIEQDSAFALAWAGIATAWTVLPFYEVMPSREGFVRGWDAAQRAMELDDGLAEVHAVFGALALYHEWDWESAEKHLLRAIELDPNYAEGHFWLGTARCFLGQRDQGIESLETTVRLSPLAGNFQSTLALFLFDAGRVQEALAVIYRESRESDPSDLWWSPLLLQQGLEEEAFRVIRRWGEIVGYSNPERLDLVLSAMQAPELSNEALGVVEDLRRTTGVQARNLSILYLMLDARAEALRSVKVGIAERDVGIPFFIPWAAAYGRERQMQFPEIMAAFEAAGIAVH